MRQFIHHLRPLRIRQTVQQIRHRRPRHRFVRRSQPLAQPVGIHPFLQPLQQRCILRQNPRSLLLRSRMTHRAIELPQRHKPRIRLHLRKHTHAHCDKKTTHANTRSTQVHLRCQSAATSRTGLHLLSCMSLFFLNNSHPASLTMYLVLRRCFWRRWLERESNPRHEDFQSSALPTELSSR